MNRTIPGLLLSWLLAGLAFLPGGCTGSGSEIGPHARSRAKGFLRGVVVTPAGEPLVSALVRLPGGEEAVTGRTGRFLVPYPRPGFQVLEVDGRNAAAEGGGSFGRIRFGAFVEGGAFDLGRRVVLPDLGSGASARLAQGVLSSRVELNTGTALLALDPGSRVELEGESGDFTLSLVSMEGTDLPSPLPSVGGVPLAGLSVCLDPPSARFSPSASLTLPNDLGLSAGADVPLYRLDPSSGRWVEAAGGRVSDDGSWIQVSSGVTTGGIYTFIRNLPSSAGAYVTGLVQNLDGLPVAGALVQGPEGRSARVLADGSFQLGPLARTDGTGAARTVNLVVRTCGGWTSARTLRSLAMNSSGDTSAGTIVLDALPAATLAVVAAYRGKSLPFKKVTGGTESMVLQGRLDERGVLEWDEVPLGKAEARMCWISRGKYYNGGSGRDLEVRDGWYEARVLAAEGNPRPDNVDRTLAVRTVSLGGGAPLRWTRVFLGEGPAPPRSGLTDDEAFESFYGVRGAQDVTAYRLFERGSGKLRAVTTFAGVDNAFFDLPLPVLSLSTGSRYRPFGVVEGSLTGSSGGTLGMAGRPRMDEWDLREAFLEGTDPAGEAPLLESPPSFRAGVPRKGTLVAWELDPAAGSLRKMGFSRDLPARPGRVLGEDLALDIPASAVLDLQGPLATLDPALSPAQVTCGLGLLLPGGEALLVKDDLTPSVSGTSLRVAAPPLEGRLAGATYLLEVEARGTSGGVTRVQKVLAKGTTRAFTAPFLSLPALSKPSPGAVVGEGELEAAWTVPSGTTAVHLQLQWSQGAEKGRWEVWLRPERNTFKFFSLPQGAFRFLPSGGTKVRLTLTCYHHEGSYLSEKYTFDRFAGALAWGTPARLGVTALSSVSLEVTAR